MRPYTIPGVQHSRPDLTPFEKFEEFARKIANVPKVEADRVKAEEEAKKKATSAK